MAAPRLVTRAPVACAACYGQKPGTPHIDFRAAIEGAPVNASPRAARVDWVVICADCVRNAYNLLPDQVEQREQLERKIVQLTERAESAERYSDSLEETLSQRPQRAQPAPAVASGRKNRYDRAKAQA